jgi:hypothetical protein
MEAWIVAAVVATVAIYCWHRWRQLARAEFIRSYTFPHGLFDKVRAKRPQLDTKQLQLVAHALRQFFLAYLRGGRRYVSMPSQVADDLWHEFILYTRDYDAFCRQAFGGFLHHTPAVVLSHERHKKLTASSTRPTAARSAGTTAPWAAAPPCTAAVILRVRLTTVPSRVSATPAPTPPRDVAATPVAEAAAAAAEIEPLQLAQIAADQCSG